MTSLLITKNGKLFVYWSELRIGNDLSQWLSSCEQEGDFAEVAEGEVEKIIRYTTETLQNPIVENETMIILNDCYEVGELICATRKCTTDFGCDLKKCQWQSFAYFKEPKREQETIDKNGELKEAFFKKFGKQSFRGYPLDQCWSIWEFFEPYLK